MINDLQNLQYNSDQALLCVKNSIFNKKKAIKNTFDEHRVANILLVEAIGVARGGGAQLKCYQ